MRLRVSSIAGQFDCGSVQLLVCSVAALKQLGYNLKRFVRVHIAYTIKGDLESFCKLLKLFCTELGWGLKFPKNWLIA